MLQNSYTNLKINGEISEEKIPFERGTKQGDVISPILFLLFMALLQFTLQKVIKRYNNPITGMAMHSTAIMDNVLIVSDDEKDIKKRLDTIVDFSVATGIRVNPGKSAYAWLNCTPTLRSCIDYTLFKLLADRVPYKYLGVWISLNLNWNFQKSVLMKSTHFVLQQITSKFYIRGNFMVTHI